MGAGAGGSGTDATKFDAGLGAARAEEAAVEEADDEEEESEEAEGVEEREDEGGV